MVVQSKRNIGVLLLVRLMTFSTLLYFLCIRTHHQYNKRSSPTEHIRFSCIPFSSHPFIQRHDIWSNNYLEFFFFSLLEQHFRNAVSLFQFAYNESSPMYNGSIKSPYDHRLFSKTLSVWAQKKTKRFTCSDFFWNDLNYHSIRIGEE